MSVVDVPPLRVTVYTSVPPSLTACASPMLTVSAVVSTMSPAPWPSATVTAVLLGVPRFTSTLSVPSTSWSVSVGTLTVALVLPAGIVTVTGWPLMSSTGSAVPA